MLSWKIDPFPFCEREWAWYPLIVKDGQTELDREKVEALLRHVWHSVMPFFLDDLEEELTPDGPHEQEIAEKVDARAGQVNNGGPPWKDSDYVDLCTSLSFDPSESESEYLELRLAWHREPGPR